MRSYRVWELGSPKAMKIDHLDDLVPGAREVIIAVKAAAVGFVDTLVVSGRYQSIPPLPFTPGMEFAGTVHTIGADVTGVAKGDRVAAYVLNGAFAEQAVARVGEFYPVPEDIPWEQAALLCGAYLTAYFALVERGQFKAGDRVLIGGAGGAVGLAAIQIAKALGAGTVLGAFRSDADRQAILEAGADAAIDISGGNLRDALRPEVMDATDGRGVDVVIDPIGGEFFAAALRSLAWSGRLVVVGFAAGEIPTVKANYLLLKNIAVLGLELSQYRRHAPERLIAAQAELFRLWRVGGLTPRIAQQFSFEAIPEALEFVSSGRTGGRATIRIGEGAP